MPVTQVSLRSDGPKLTPPSRRIPWSRSNLQAGFAHRGASGTPKSRSNSSVYTVDVHLGLYNPPPQVPSGACNERRRAPQPTRADSSRTLETARAEAPCKSCSTCQRIEGSPSSSHAITSAWLLSAFNLGLARATRAMAAVTFGASSVRLESLARQPASAALPLSEFLTILAARVGAQQLTRIEPVLRARRSHQRRRIARKLWIVRAARMPQGAALWKRFEARDFFHAAIAVRGHNQNLATQSRSCSFHAQDHVVVKLALLPMIDELVCPPTTTNFIEHTA